MVIFLVQYFVSFFTEIAYGIRVVIIGTQVVLISLNVIYCSIYGLMDLDEIFEEYPSGKYSVSTVRYHTKKTG